MNHRIIFVITIILTFSFYTRAQEKIPLDHSVYDSWQNLDDFKISNDGKWVFFEQNPQKGDGFLVLTNLETNKADTIPRGGNANFSPNSDFLVFKISPQQDTIRKLKIDKANKEKFPKDSLGIIVLGSDTILKFERVKTYKLFKDSSSWLVYHKEKEIEKKKEEKKDTTTTTLDKKPKKEKKKSKKELEQEKLAAEKQKEIDKKEKEAKELEKKQKGTELVIYNPINGAKHSYKNIDDFDLDKKGNLVSFIRVKKDSLDTSIVFVFHTAKEILDTIFKEQGLSKKTTVNTSGNSVAFIHSQDTTKQKTFSLYLWNKGEIKKIIDSLSNDIPRNWTVSEFGNIYFSEDDSKLYFGTNLKPEVEKEDSILDEEKYQLDIWHWQDPYLQPQQKINLKKEQERSYLAVYLIEKEKINQLADTLIRDVRIKNKGNSDYAIGIESLKYQYMQQWESDIPRDYYLININTGTKELIAENVQHNIQLSTGNKYLFWFDMDKQQWLLRSVDDKNTVSLTANIKVNFFDEENDIPDKPNSYGIIGWTKEDKYLLIYDRYDIWKIDPTMNEKPYNLTAGYGRDNKIKFKNIWLDNDKHYLENNEKMLLNAFYESDKKSGFYSTKVDSKEKPVLLIDDKCFFRQPTKAKNADKLMWRKETYNLFPDISISNMDFTDIKTISNANPQQANYLWGTAELVKWNAYDKKNHEGLLYKPENFDPNKKYPMLVYFYEKNSDQLYRHYTPHPIRSVIGFPYYTSNDYIIFVPDIHYGTGHPGKDAYNSIVSGTDFIVDMGFVDKDKIGIQGQSWGGYQVAYLITQTDKYAAAEAGAPVSNMTSAYGGIRWGTGMSRQFQYEKAQSRIGTTLWNNLDLYIENSPVFFADKVNTPLLIMHNDNDGAVPWYQGIEYFTALRRLQKPVWMLTYNEEEHNLMKRPNCVDLTIRMAQFFDHYLKDAPAPEWLINGRAATDKGKNDRYDLID